MSAAPGRVDGSEHDEAIVQDKYGSPDLLELRDRSLSHLRRALAPEGILVIVGGEGGGKWSGGIDRQLRAHALSPFVRQKLGTWISTEREEDLKTLHELLEAGKLTPIVHRTFPLSEVPDAIRYLRDGRAHGKVVITV